MADTKTMGRAAQAAVIEALMNGTYSQGELTISHVNKTETVRELISALANVVHVEWEGESGVPYRSYRGRLPSGLKVDIITDRDFVEQVEV